MKTTAATGITLLTTATFAMGAVLRPGFATPQADTVPTESLRGFAFDPGAMAEGRAVAALVARRDATALFARFTPEMAQACGKDALKQLLAEAVPAGSLGAPVSEVVTRKAGQPTVYTVCWASAPRPLSLKVTLLGKRVAGFLLSDAPPVAAGERALALQTGHEILTLLEANRVDQVYSRFAPAFAAQLSRTGLARLLQSTFGAGLSGKRLTEAAICGPDGEWTIAAVYSDKAGRDLSVFVVLASTQNRQVAGMRLVPTPSATLPPDPRASYQTRTALHLPFAPGDKWTVIWGGNTRSENYHVDYPDQRHAYDLSIVQNGTTHRGDGTENGQYFAWGKTIVAPAPGTVVSVANDVPDNRPGAMNPAQTGGNHVLLDFGRGEYGLLAHLQQGSVTVRKGQTVRAGQVIGRCGNSGNSTEPHLHFHLQDNPSLFRDAHGLPAPFTDYRADDKPVARGLPLRGNVVQAK